MDERDQLEPVVEVWTGSKVAWDPLHPTLPKHAAAIPEDDFLAILGEEPIVRSGGEWR